MSTDVRTRAPLVRSTGVPDIAVWMPARVAAAILSLAVVLIHVMDQGGFPGSKDPRYVGIGYYLLESGGVVAAALLLSRTHYRKGWFLALGVALGPLVGYVLSRGPGMPSYTDDQGNWTETLGIVSILVEGSLLLAVLGAAACRRRRLDT